jgi:2-iminobutanoate/2-iminopropanoate deaminase
MKVKIEQVSTSNAPGALGPYSQAVRAGDLMFCSGQVPLDPKTGQVVAGGISEQTEQVMKNIGAVLHSQDLDFSSVVKSTVFLKNMGDFAAFNSVYEKHLTTPYPARSTVEVARLPKDVLIEIEVLAYIPHS